MSETPEPTQDEINAAKALLASVSKKTENAETVAIKEFVHSDEFNTLYDMALTAQRAAPANTEVNYIISMMARLRQTHPA